MPATYQTSCCCTCTVITAGGRDIDTPWHSYRANGTLDGALRGNLRMSYERQAFGQPYEAFWQRDADHANTARCHKLLVYRGVKFAGNAVHPDSVGQLPDFVLTTNAVGRKNPGGGPFETTPGSGVLLDTEPYWFASCNMGGWALDPGLWYQPPIEEIDAIRASPLGNGRYTILILLSLQHTVRDAAHGGGVLIPETNGRIDIEDWRAIG